jgi:hypothetical protein
MITKRYVAQRPYEQMCGAGRGIWKIPLRQLRLA